MTSETAGEGAYFHRLGAALDRAGIAEPVLIVDTGRLDANIRAVADHLDGRQPGRVPVRVVAKSLPCGPLLRRVADGLGTRRHMVFNRFMLRDVLAVDPGADILMGKPLTQAAVRAYYQEWGTAAPAPQWLVDTPERLAQCTALARALDVPLRVNFEINVGLHRGGFDHPAHLAAVLDGLDPLIRPAGLMGYDPHIAKLPRPLQAGALRSGQRLYAAFAEVLRRGMPDGGNNLALNTAGSPTYVMHRDNPAINEVAIGSAFVKPAAFDLATLTHHVPACFIAAPVLKTQRPVRLPALPTWATSVLPGTAVFIHGGNWPADPVWPPGLRVGGVYGRSSNQERWSAPRGTAIAPDDWFFLRPWQSEATFLQFGPLVAYDGQDVVARWPAFPVST